MESSKVQLKVYVAKNILDDLWDYIKITYPESTYGALSAEVQTAIAEYLRVRHAQIHTKPINPALPTVHQACRQIIQSLKDTGHVYQVNTKVLKKTIGEIRGTDTRTLNKWISLLVRYGYLKSIGSYTWEIL